MSLLIILMSSLTVCTYANFKVDLEGQSKGDTTWTSGNLAGWKELDYIPVRVYFSGGPASNQSIRVDFDHTKGTTPGVQNLTGFTPSSGVTIVSGPTLYSPTGVDIWSYSFVVNMTTSAGFVEFRARLSAGAHYFGGSSLALAGSPSSMGVLQISKPAAVVGNPNLAIAKSAAAFALPGSTITYTLSFTNKATNNLATGAQITDVLPSNLSFTDCSGGCYLVGNVVTWDLSDLTPGTNGTLSYSVVLSGSAVPGSSFTNYATILSAEIDANLADNTDFVTTMVASNCIVPAIATAPASATKCPGDTANFFVAVNGSSPFNYFWRKNGGNIPGATNSSYSIGLVSNNDAGSYSVVVSNACGSVTSAAAALAVNNPTTATQPASLVRCPNQNATFTTTALGAGPLTYVWKKNGAFISQTNSVLTFTYVTAADAGTYTVEVSGVCNAVTNSATLSISDPTAATGLTNLTLCPNETAVFSSTISGTGPFGFVWKKDGAVLGGQTNNMLTLGAVSSVDAGTYSLEVNGQCNSITNSAILTVNSQTAASGMDDLVRCPGDDAVFSTAVSGTAPFQYLWKKNTNVLPGQTNSSLTLSAVNSNDSGTYIVEVRGACDTATIAATLTVQESTVSTPFPLTSLTKCPGDTASFATTPSGTGPFNFVWKKNGIALDESSSTLTLNQLQASDAGTYSIEINGACNSVTNTATLTINEPTAATALTGLSRCPGQNATFGVTPSGAGPFHFSWSKNGAPLAGETNSSLSLSSISASDAGTYSVEVGGACNSVTNFAVLTVYQNTFSTTLTDLTRCLGQSANFETTPSGTGPFQFIWKKNGSPLSQQTANSINLSSITEADAGTYSVEVSGQCNSVTNLATLTVNSPTGASTLTGLVRCPGQSAAFNTVPSGTGPFTFVWKKDGTVLFSQTNSTLNLAAVSTSDAGSYSVEVSGSCGSVTNIATLAVNPPTQVSPLLNQLVCGGANVVFNAAASGTGPFTYAWQRNGTTASNVTGNTLTLNSVTATNAGTYTVTVTGACGTQQSSATLAVSSPIAAAALTNQTICSCEEATFITSVSGNSPFGCVWKINNQLVFGQTNTFITLTNCKATNIVVSVEVGGGCNSVTNTATLTVLPPITSNPLILSYTNPITINDHSTATPYPASIQVRCLPGVVKKVTATLNGFTHGFPPDVDVMLAAPNGQGVKLMSDAGGIDPVNNLTLTFDDSAANSIAEFDPLASGTFKPTEYDSDDDPFYSPAPTGPYPIALAGFNNSNPNGAWSLFAVDDQTLDVGSIQRGWTLRIDWDPVAPVLSPPTRLANGDLEFMLTGLAAKAHALEFSTNLNDWVRLWTNTLTGGALIIHDPAPNSQSKFYRAIKCP